MKKINKFLFAMLALFCMFSVVTPVLAENEESGAAQPVSVSDGWTKVNDLQECTAEYQVDSAGTLTIRPLGNTTTGSLRFSGIWPWRNNSTIKKLVISGKLSPGYNLQQFCEGLSNLESVDFSGFDWTTGETPYSMYGMFDGCEKLNSVDLSSFNTSNVNDMSFMFAHCSSLETVNLSNFDTSNVTNMSNMFAYCMNLNSLNVSDFNTAKVKDFSRIFHDCEALKKIDVKNWNTSSATDMSQMFNWCSSLETIDVSGFNTAKVTTMSNMFGSCTSLTSLDCSKFNTTNVTDMSAMFHSDENLLSLDISGFNTSKVTSMNGMFYYCWQLEEIDVSKFDTSNVTNMAYMFYDCESLTSPYFLNFNTSKVTTMEGMFWWCCGLESLDLSSFDTTNTVNMNNMFTMVDYLGENDDPEEEMIKEIKLGRKFKFITSDGEHKPEFPKPSGGYWVSSVDGKSYAPNAIPSNVAATYYSVIDSYFKDVSWNTSHKDEVYWLAAQGISEGWPLEDGSKEFRPLENVARCDMAAFIRRLAKNLNISDAKDWKPTEEDWNTFTDVDKNTPHAEDVLWLAHAEISTGWDESDGTKTFRSLQSVARCDMAAFLRRLAKLMEGTDASTWEPGDEDWALFSDVDKNTPHAEDVLWLAHAGISTGWPEADGTKTFRSLQSVARCDMAAFLHRLAN